MPSNAKQQCASEQDRQRAASRRPTHMREPVEGQLDLLASLDEGTTDQQREEVSRDG